jgi:hypothetical protein
VPKTNRPPEPELTDRQLLKKLKRDLLVAELKSTIRLVEARHQMIAIAKDMLPDAAGFARKGRPRLLSTCQKILTENTKQTAAVVAGPKPKK